LTLTTLKNTLSRKPTSRQGTQIDVRDLNRTGLIPVQVFLALAATSAGLLSWWVDGRGLWLAGGMVIFAVIPFTLIAIRPTNRQLLDPGLDRTSTTTRRLLRRWGILHAVRTALSLTASCIFLSLVV
jgi:hypothetical protein